MIKEIALSFQEFTQHLPAVFRSSYILERVLSLSKTKASTPQFQKVGVFNDKGEYPKYCLNALAWALNE